MKKLGIIGGLGPMATAYFLQILVQMSDARSDQEHMEVYMISRPAIPDRTDYILGISDRSPVPEMIDAGKKLKFLGVDILAMPCITAHYFHKELESSVGIPIVNAIVETVDYLQSRDIRRVGIMATDGTIKSRLFQETLESHAIDGIVPDERNQKKVMEIIYDEVKAGRQADMEKFKSVSQNLREKGAQVILLACTELSLIKRDDKVGAGYLDVMEVLAAKAVENCSRLRKECVELIT